MHLVWVITLIIGMFILLATATMGGMMGWKLANITHELKLFPSESISTFDFENGDLILFSSNMAYKSSAISSVLQMIITDCPITHVGMVVQNPGNGLFRCWEMALGEDIADMIRVTNLNVRLQSYNGTVLIRRLRGPHKLSCEDTYKFVRKILNQQNNKRVRYRASFYLNTYDCRTSDFLFMHPPLPIVTNKNDNSKNAITEWICTDLVSATYHALGVFSTIDLTLWPRDFYSKRDKLPMCLDWEFSSEILLTPGSFKISGDSIINKVIL